MVCAIESPRPGMAAVRHMELPFCYRHLTLGVGFHSSAVEEKAAELAACRSPGILEDLRNPPADLTVGLLVIHVCHHPSRTPSRDVECFWVGMGADRRHLEVACTAERTNRSGPTPTVR